MCGRFTLRARLNDLLSQFAALAQGTVEEYYPLFERYNIPPTVDVPAVRQVDGERQLTMMRWGLIPSWTKDPKDLPLNNNARSETIAEKPSFRTAYKKRRCIIPASGFYEWLTEGKKKTPFYFHSPDQRLLAIAGIWEAWGEVESFAIVTTDANEVMAPIHHRMPVILGVNDYDRWLDPTIESVPDLLTPCPANELTCYQVSQFVNNARNEGPECVEPLPKSNLLFD